MLIIFSSFYAYKKAIHAKSLFKNKDFDEEIDDKEIIKKTRKLAKTSFLALAPFRILSYTILNK